MRKRSWLRRVALALVVLVVVSAGFSRSLRLGRVHRYLNARLEAAFGRPVRVGEFSFSLLDGLRLEADSITVAEDPRFGYEYFLRAERLTAGLRWSALARGRFEFGTLSFTRPSLNLVRTADGHWNLESWLPPPPAEIPATGVAGVSAPARLYRIKVDTGRINFKLGSDKHPFALIEVTGDVEQETAGRWRIDLKARPMRAAVALPEAGTLRVRGRIAGTSARLQPAELALTWQDASLADALRLARGQDYGARGRLDVELTVRSAPPGANSATPTTPPKLPITTVGPRWAFTATARLRDAHRWDLPQRPGDPALNLRAEAEWFPDAARIELSRCVLEAPRSSVEVSGGIGWAAGLAPIFHLRSSWISFADLLVWYRAFRPGVTESLTLEGSGEINLTVSGWPPRIEDGGFSSSGARLQATALPEPVRLGGILARVRRGQLELAPTTVFIAAGTPDRAAPPGAPARAGPAASSVAPRNALRVQGTIGPAKALPRVVSQGWQFTFELAGETDRAQDWLAAAQALGYTLNRGWSAAGPVEVRLSWQGSVRPFSAGVAGTIGLRGLEWRTDYLNHPVLVPNALIELRGSERRVTLTAAGAFGGHWQGTLRRSDPTAAWEFDLSVDRLDAAELDRWLGPRARPGLLERMLPFAAASRSTSELDTLLGSLRGKGRLRVEEFFLAPLSLRKLSTEAEIEGRTIRLSKAAVEFCKGSAEGTLTARLAAGPAYDFDVQFDGVDLKVLGDATASLRDRIGGTASGKLMLAARGIGRQDLVRSLEGYGLFRVRGARIRGLDVRAVVQGGSARGGPSQFATAEARFSLASEKIEVENLRLTDRDDDFEAEGSINFSRILDLRLRPVPPAKDDRPGGPTSRTFRITGPLDAPQVTPLDSGSGKRGAKK